MTVQNLVDTLSLKVLAGEDELEREILGCYAGDLLSWVMARAESGDVWLTVMGNINAVAVASLTDCACIVLTESAALDEDAKKRADMQGIPILTTEQDTYAMAIAVSRLLPEAAQ